MYKLLDNGIRYFTTLQTNYNMYSNIYKNYTFMAPNIEINCVLFLPQSQV